MSNKMTERWFVERLRPTDPEHKQIVGPISKEDATKLESEWMSENPTLGPCMWEHPDDVKARLTSQPQRPPPEQYPTNFSWPPWQPTYDPVVLAMLGKLGEELGELSAIVNRCIIQGVDASEPVTHRPNKEALRNECADVINMIEIVSYALGLDSNEIRKRIDQKGEHINEWLVRILPLKPCGCGCTKIVPDGLMEYAHPDDYRHERG